MTPRRDRPPDAHGVHDMSTPEPTVAHSVAAPSTPNPSASRAPGPTVDEDGVSVADAPDLDHPPADNTCAWCGGALDAWELIGTVAEEWVCMWCGLNGHR